MADILTINYQEAMNCKKYKHHNLTEEDVRQKIARTIYSIRRFKNITQASLAEKIGVSAPQMLNYENCAKIPIPKLDSICRVLDIDLIQMLEHCIYDSPLVRQFDFENYVQFL